MKTDYSERKWGCFVIETGDYEIKKSCNVKETKGNELKKVPVFSFPFDFEIK